MGKDIWDPSGYNFKQGSLNGPTHTGDNYDYSQLSCFLNHDSDPDYVKRMLKEIADGLDRYIELVEMFGIIEKISVKEYDQAIETVKKAIKSLRKGSLKYLNIDRMNAITDSGGHVCVSEMNFDDDWDGDDE